MTGSTDTVRMTYRELAQHFGIGLDSARIKAQRHIKAGRWKLIPGNYPGALVVVELPAEYLKAAPQPAARSARPEPRNAPAAPAAEPAPAAPSFDAAVVAGLLDELARFRGELEQERTERNAERDQWRTTIEQLESSRAEEIERLQADRRAERERIRELVGKLIEDTSARDQELRQRAEAAERRAEFARAEAVQARTEAAGARERLDASAAQVERLTGALDRIHKDRESEVEEFAALAAERDALLAEVKRLSRPWWRRLFGST